MATDLQSAPTSADSGRALQVLADVFGYDSFRAPQAEIIAHVQAGGDALVVMPTGSGKSLCYQIPSIIRPGVGVVVSPLIALMEDQVAALSEAGVRVAMLNSSMTASQQSDVLQRLRRGEIDLFYAAPERLLTDNLLDLLARIPVALFAIDEAHCVARWGHDFRPEYLGLSVLHERFPNVPRLALTATADERTRAEIAQRLGLTDAAHFVTGFDRPNIRYAITPRTEARRQLWNFLDEKHPDDSGIVYCLTRARTEQIAAYLEQRGRIALPYHAGMNQGERRANQKRFVREDAVVMVATIAFGMGIDKPDVRFVAHIDLPRSIEAYYQETGRSGRDGLSADAWMSYGLSDAITHRRFIEQSDADESFKKIEHHKLDALIGLCETTTCRRATLLDYFGDPLAVPCGNCDNCLNPPKLWDATLAARKALFVVRATGERFGTAYLIEILLGKTSERIERLRHDKLSAFGRGAELSEPQWRAVFRRLIALGYLSVDVEGFGSLRLASASRDVLEQRVQVQLREDVNETRASRAKRDRSAPSPPLDVRAEDAALYEALRGWRLDIARAQDVSPFIIFDNKTLREIARRRPSSADDLRQIPGIGEKRLSVHGEQVLAIVGRHLDR